MYFSGAFFKDCRNDLLSQLFTHVAFLDVGLCLLPLKFKPPLIVSMVYNLVSCVYCMGRSFRQAMWEVILVQDNIGYTQKENVYSHRCLEEMFFFLYNWPIHSSTSCILLDFNKFAFLKREDSHLKRMQSILPSHKFQFSRIEWLCKLFVIKKKNTKNYFSERQQ